MSNDPFAPQNHADWQLLAEFMLPSRQEKQADIIAHAADVLRQFSLDPGQLDQILSAISQSLETLQDSVTPLRLRISVSGADLAEAWQESFSQVDSDDDQRLPRAGGGLGFFLVKRIVSQLQDQDQEKYRLVEVLLYRE